MSGSVDPGQRGRGGNDILILQLGKKSVFFYCWLGNDTEAAGRPRYPPFSPRVTLVGGGDASEGNVVANNRYGRNGSLCVEVDDHFGAAEADVVCRQAGHAAGARAFTRRTFFREPRRDELGFDTHDSDLAHLQCRGGEGAIQDCSHSVGQRTCRDQVAGVVCAGEFCANLARRDFSSSR